MISDLLLLSGRALGNLRLSHESLGNFEKAIAFQEQHLSIAAQINDKTAKTLAYSSLGEYFVNRSNFVSKVVTFVDIIQ